MSEIANSAPKYLSTCSVEYRLLVLGLGEGELVIYVNSAWKGRLLSSPQSHCTTIVVHTQFPLNRLMVLENETNLALSVCYASFRS